MNTSFPNNHEIKTYNDKLHFLFVFIYDEYPGYFRPREKSVFVSTAAIGTRNIYNIITLYVFNQSPPTYSIRKTEHTLGKDTTHGTTTTNMKNQTMRICSGRYVQLLASAYKV